MLRVRTFASVACAARSLRRDSRRCERPNLRESVGEVVGEMCPHPAPATSEKACKCPAVFNCPGVHRAGGSEARAG